MEELYRINLQLFAESTEDDNPEVPDVDDNLDDDDWDDDETDGSLLEAAAKAYDESKKAAAEPEDEPEDDATEDEPDEQPEARSDEQPEPEEQPEQKSGPVEFTPDQKEIINRIVQDRLAREREKNEQVLQHIRALEALHGKGIEQIVQDQRAAQIATLTEQYLIDEQEAQRIVSERERLAALEAERQALAERQAEIEARARYEAQKQAYLAQNPQMRAFAQKYAAEIDAAAGNGNVDYDVAFAFVMGQKVLQGDLLETVKRTTEQRVIADVQKQRKATPVGTGTAAGANADPTEGLTSLERQLARAFGVSPKNVAKRKKALSKRL